MPFVKCCLKSFKKVKHCLFELNKWLWECASKLNRVLPVYLGVSEAVWHSSSDFWPFLTCLIWDGIRGEWVQLWILKNLGFSVSGFIPVVGYSLSLWHFGFHIHRALRTFSSLLCEHWKCVYVGMMTSDKLQELSLMPMEVPHVNLLPVGRCHRPASK